MPMHGHVRGHARDHRRPLPGGRRAAAACALAFLAALPAVPAAGQVVDQECAAATSVWRRCGGTGRSLFQGFMPRFTPLAGVALDIRQVPASGETIHVRVRAGWTQGPVVAEAVALVTADGWMRFDFAEPVAVNPGRDYVLEWVEPQAWWAVAEGNRYARGEAYNCGETILPLDDYNFRTFAPEAHVEFRTWAEVKAILAGARAR